jgi:hypothetical protein
LKKLICLMLTAISAAALAQNAVPPKPEGVDLDVTVIDRTPRYPAYRAAYKDYGYGVLADPTIDPVQKDVTKRWPDNGEEVTLTGRIANKGTQASPAAEYTWLLDGKKVGGGTIKKLEPAEYAAVVYKWKWALEPHVIELVVDPDNKVKETFEQNNRLVHDTLAKVLHFAMTRGYYENANNWPNLMGTYSGEDHLQWYVNHMNLMFKNAVYAGTPNGCRERVRMEIVVTEDEAGKQEWYKQNGGDVQQAGFDGAWSFGWGPGAEKWLFGIDWGLPHELGHQLGIIDLYQHDVFPEDNLVPDDQGDPLLLGHWSDEVDCMMRNHGPVPWSEHTAYGMDTHITKRRGFYGVYLFAIPEKNYLQIVDNQGYLVAGARITAWQARARMMVGEPVFSGTTGPDGRFLMPNRPTGIPRTTTELGYEYHDNPFGAISIIGTNNMIVFQVQARGHTEYQWLEVTRLNLAYFRGEKDETTCVYQTRIPHLLYPPAPKGVRAERVGDAVKIAWDRAADAPAVTAEAAKSGIKPEEVWTTNPSVSYAVYRGLGPEYNKWEKIGGTGANQPTEFTDKTPPAGSVRYAVSAIDTSRSESGFSAFCGIAMLQKPAGIAALPNGRLVLADAGLNQLVFMKPDGSAVGPFNSIHNHAYAHDVAVSSDGMVAYTDWPDGYVPNQVGYWMRPVTRTNEDIGSAFKKDIGPGEDQISEPTGIAFDEQGNILLTESGNNRVTCFDRGGKILWRYVGKDAESLKNPSRAVSWKGWIAIADTGNDRVQLVDPKGGKPALTISGLKSPRYVAVTGGQLAVSDTGSGTIRFFDLPGDQPKQAASFDGSWHIGTAAGDGTNRKLEQPVGVTIVGDDRYAVVDAGTKNVVFFKSTGP